MTRREFLTSLAAGSIALPLHLKAQGLRGPMEKVGAR